MNVRNANQALAWYEAQAATGTNGWADLCDHLAANAVGFEHSGYDTAWDHWQSIDPNYRRGPSSTPNMGDYVFWEGGQGHIAMYAGFGTIYSQDILRHGRVDLVRIGLITQKWGLAYAGSTHGAPDPNGSGSSPYPPFTQRYQSVSLDHLLFCKHAHVPSPDVETVQVALNRYVGLDYSTGPGWFGPRTTVAWDRAAAKSRRSGLHLLRFLGVMCSRFVAVP